MLLELLRDRVASPLSYNSLARDLQVSPHTIKRYIGIIESLHIVFLLRPYHQKLSRSILREPKLYFYDTGLIKGDEGVKLENTIAVCLLKYVEYLRDAKGKNISLDYLKTKDGKEADFVITDNGEVTRLMEVKLTHSKLSRSLIFFSKKFPGAEAFQLVHNLRHTQYKERIHVVQAGEWLARLDV
jgi:predicted AAA+ superfamily ATPase